MTKTDTQPMYAVLLGPDLDKAHDQLAQSLDDPDAGNDDIRAAAIDIGVRSGYFSPVES